jgi:hypothetical protein
MMVEDLHILWKHSGLFARASVCVAAAAAIAHLSALAGAGADGPWAAFLALHIAVMLLGFCAFTRQLRRSRVVTAPSLAVATPASLKWLTFVGGLYCFAWFIGVFTYYGEGGAEHHGDTYAWVANGVTIRTLTAAQYNSFQANTARVFSAAWFFFALFLALWHFRRDVGRRSVSYTVLPNER